MTDVGAAVTGDKVGFNLRAEASLVRGGGGRIGKVRPEIAGFEAAFHRGSRRAGGFASWASPRGVFLIDRLVATLDASAIESFK